MKLPHRWMFAVVLLTTLAVSSSVGQTIEPSNRQPVPIALGSVHAVAGEAKSVTWISPGGPWSSISSTKTSPPLTSLPSVDVNPPSSREALRIAIPPTTPPGEYQVDIAGRNQNGQEFSATLDLRVAAATIKRSPSGKPPVILLNGFQPSCALVDNASTVEGSTGTFGHLAKYLNNDDVPVAFFNNCSYGDSVSIEQLAEYLRLFIAGLTFDDGTPVDQVDLVAHSMGGLIARAYLAGMRSTRIPSHLSDGSFLPLLNHKVRKLILVATPNFGSFQAPLLAPYRPGKSAQLTELTPGSWFLWNLATWNQRGDDMRQVDALAVIGDAGTFSGSGRDDGVVSSTSASLGFSRLDDQTRIVSYCHTDRVHGLVGLVAPLGMDCKDHNPIAYIDSEAHDTARIIRSFLQGDPAWKSIGQRPSQHSALSQFGGVYFAMQSAKGDWISDLVGVSFGNIPLNEGGARKIIFLQDLIPGRTDTFGVTSASYGSVSCGPSTQPVGFYNVILCKFSTVISSVAPQLSTTSGLVVRSGAMITISGTGFGQQRCALCGVIIDPYDYGPPNSEVIPSGDIARSWSDQTITAFLPPYSGLLKVYVAGPNGASDSINILAVPPAPSISLSKTQLQFSYVLGGVLPVAQAVTVSNGGSGTLVWSAVPHASWISVSSSPTKVTVSANPSGLSPGTYTGTVSVTASGATNSPQSISVTLTVESASTLPVITEVVNAASLRPDFSPNSWVSIKGANLAPATRIWNASDFVDDQLPIALDGIRVTIDGKSAYVYYISPSQVNILTPPDLGFTPLSSPGNLIGQKVVQVQVTNGGAVSSSFAAPAFGYSMAFFTFDGSHVAATHADGSIIGPRHLYPGSSTPAVSNETVILYGNGFGPASSPVVDGSVTQSGSIVSPSVTIGNTQAVVRFAGLVSPGLYQFNVDVPASLPSGEYALTANYIHLRGISTQAGVTLTVEAPTALISLATLTVASASVTGGQSTTGQVTLSDVGAAGGVDVQLSSSNGAVRPPTSVRVEAGQKSATFTITTTVVSSTQTATITASLNEVQRTVNLAVQAPTPVSPFRDYEVAIRATFAIDGNQISPRITSGFPLPDYAEVNTTGAAFDPNSKIILLAYFDQPSYTGNSVTYKAQQGNFTNLSLGSTGSGAIISGSLTLTAPSRDIGTTVTGTLQFSTSSKSFSVNFNGTIVSSVHLP